MPPFVYSRIHSRTIFSSSSECRSSIEGGGGASAANILLRTIAGSSFVSGVRVSNGSRACVSSCSVDPAISSVERCVGRFCILVQKDSLDARAFATDAAGVVEMSDDGVEMSEDKDRGDEDRGTSNGGRSRSWAGKEASIGVINLTWSSLTENCTRGPLESR